MRMAAPQQLRIGDNGMQDSAGRLSLTAAYRPATPRKCVESMSATPQWESANTATASRRMRHPTGKNYGSAAGTIRGQQQCHPPATNPG